MNEPPLPSGCRPGAALSVPSWLPRRLQNCHLQLANPGMKANRVTKMNVILVQI